MNKLTTMFSHKIFHIFKWAFLVLIGLFIILVIIRFFNYSKEDKTNNQVLKIHSTKLSMEDVLGVNLPDDPGINADKTVEGIDSNKNGIRDDIELDVFKEYPNSLKSRAVLLQYALALQMETNQPFIDTTIATEIAREQSRAFVCIGDIVSREDSQKFDEETDILTKFIKDRMFNTEERNNARDVFVENIRSYSELDQVCDIDYSKLTN
jgi:hypothetical protein